MHHAPSFRHIAAPFRTFCGVDALQALPGELDRLGTRRAAVFCGRSIREHPTALGRVAEILGKRLAGIFDGVKEHSPVPTVLAGKQVLKDLGADAVIAIGGGSAIVTARAASILLGETGDVYDLCTRRDASGRLMSPKLLAPKLRQWVIPTIATTAYAKAGSAIRDPDTGRRLTLFDPKTRAHGVFLDPVLALSTPTPLVLPSAINAFAMCIEGLQSNFTDPIAEAHLSHALRMLCSWLPRLTPMPDDSETRLQLMLAALLCGLGSDHAGGGLAQALAHAAGPRSGVANGIIEAILLPHSMRFNAPVTAAGLARVAEALAAGGIAEPESLQRSLDVVARKLADLSIPARLRDVGVARAQFAEIADETLDDWWLTRAPRKAERADLTMLLEAAW